MFQELHDFESKMSKEEEEEKRYLCTVNDLCSVQLFQWDKPQTHKKKLQKKPTKQKCKKKKNHFYWQGVLLVCFWFVRFWFLY